MAKAKGAKKKAAAKAKPKAKAKAKAKAKPAPAKKAVMAKPAADSGLAKRVAAVEAAIAALKKATSGGKGDAGAIDKAIDAAAADIRQRAEDADHVAMAEVRKHVDKVAAELAAADERLHSEIGAVDAKGDMKMDDINALRRRVDELEARVNAKK